MTGPRTATTGMAALLATSCGTALAAVCALGLYEIQRLAAGLWGLLAVLLAAAVSAALAGAFTRLATVVPSGAALLAYLARAYGRRLGLLLALPYITMTLFLVGAESTVSAALLHTRWALPVPLLALLFLLTTWAVCRAGVRIGFAVQAGATWLLVAGLVGASLAALARAWSDGSLGARLLPAPPDPGAFVAASAQALFLFMGFELITAQIELADAATLGRALRHSVHVLASVYGLLVLGFACLDGARLAATPGTLVVPQLALAEQSAGSTGALALIALSLLASFTSFNGALLALSRCVAALAAQGVLPRALMRVEPRSLVPRRALLLLLSVAVASTVLVQALGLLHASLLAAAATTALAYASVAWARERAPFVEAARAPLRRRAGQGLALLLAVLAVGVFVDGGAAAPRALAVLGVALLGAALLARRVVMPRPPLPAAAGGAEPVTVG